MKKDKDKLNRFCSLWLPLILFLGLPLFAFLFIPTETTGLIKYVMCVVLMSPISVTIWFAIWFGAAVYEGCKNK